MKRIKSRTMILVTLLVILAAGMAVYLFRYIAHGAEWASYKSNTGYYNQGILSVGRILDCNGVILSEYGEKSLVKGRRLYADEKITRISTLHAVGDTYGYIRTGATKVFASKLLGYNLINGSYSLRSGGNDLYMTIDSELNNAAYKAMDGRKGCVGVYNYKTGEVVCMVSAPSYDPVAVPDDLNTNSKYEGVYINRFLSSSYTPGSTFKVLTAAAALENLPDVENFTYTCIGSEEIGGSSITCTKAHGELNLEGALAYSCNCYFGTLATELGSDTLAAYFSDYKLDESMDIDGVITAKGRYTEPENENDLAWSGIGQYKDLVNPASMLRLMGAIANGGNAAQLRLIKTVKTSVGIPDGLYLTHKTRLMSAATADMIADMMRNDVEEVYGAERFEGLDICAKSGTAEVGNGKEPHALFVGFVRNEDLPLAFVVVVENGGRGSTVAGNVANAVLQTALEKVND